MSKDNSKLLIDEHPLQVLPTLACKFGLNGAIVLQQVHYWLVLARKAKDDRKFIEGRWWVYNSYEEWKENFPWWSLPTIKRTILHLEKYNLLISKEMRAQDWDHTKWYSVNYDALNELTDSIKVIPSEDSDQDNPEGQDESLLNRNTETTTETTTENIYTDPKKLKDSCLSILQSFGYSVFGNDMTNWWSFRRRLDDDGIVIVGDKQKMTVSGLSKQIGQFTEAEVWTDRYGKQFA